MTMNCRQVRQKLNEYDLGVLPEALAAQVEAHVEGCANCRQELEEYRRIAASVGRSSAATADDAVGRSSRATDAAPVPDLWPAVRARLKPRRRAVVLMQNAWEPALAVAAAALIAAVLFHGTILPGVTPADTSFDLAANVASDEQLVAVSWQQPMSDEAALGMSLALLDAGGGDG